MQGRSHLLIGLAASVAFDSIMHVSGPPLFPLFSSRADLATLLVELPDMLLLNKALYYSAVGIGALLPDIDHAGSTLGRKLGPISKAISSSIGHRTLFHSVLGLTLGAVIVSGGELALLYILAGRGVSIPASVLASWHVFLLGILFGVVLHILCDLLTKSGVPLLWPYKQCFGFPPPRRLRFRTGSWPEHAIVWITLLLLTIGLWVKVIII